MNFRVLLDKISTNLSLIAYKIEIENAANNMSLNVILERQFLKILNLIFNYELDSTNKFKANYPGIDGLDLKNGIMAQVASKFPNKKIEDTINIVLEKQYYLNAKKLYFIFLNNNKKIRKEFYDKIAEKIDNKFHLSFEESFIDFKDLYKLLQNYDDIQKLNDINNLLESTLLEIVIHTKLNCIAVSFNEEEIENAYSLSNILAQMGYNIIIDSEKLYEKFKNENSIFVDNIIVIKEYSKIDFIDKIIIIVSPKHIEETIDNDFPNCRLFLQCSKKNIRPLLLNFSELLSVINNKKFKNPKSVTANNASKIEKIVTEYLEPQSHRKYNFEEIKKVLVSLFPTQQFRSIAEEKFFSLYNFTYGNSVINFLVFSHDFKRNEVIEYFESNFAKKYSANLTVLIPKDYNQTTNLRLIQVQEKFKTNTVRFLDEFLYEECIKKRKITLEKRLHENVFIPPFFKLEEEKETLDDIFDWLKNDKSSVIFIIGNGGDGKTTVCEKIHDEIIDNIDNQIVIFLDAHAYIENIRKRELYDKWKFDLQTVFEVSNNEMLNLDLNTFKSNFAFGNITVIIDGIDEIISTLPTFNLIDFLEDFNQLEETIGKGKIIISCRDIHINETLETKPSLFKKYKFFNLLKFNRNLAEKYFQKYFYDNDKNVKNSLKLLDDFYPKSYSEEFIYSPFVLEVITLIVENNFEYREIEFNFRSDILLENNSNDFLTYKIIEREISKKEEHGFIINVDEYLRLLGLIAIEKNGVFILDDFNLLLKKIGVDLNSEKVTSSLKDNPFFCFEKEKYHFRFDFYNAVFKYNAIFSRLIFKESFILTDSFITMLSEDLIYSSILYEGVKEKIKNSNLSFIDILLKIEFLINDINNFNKEINHGYEYTKQKAISNIFILLIELNDKSYSTSELIKIIFSDKLVYSRNLISIKNFYLIDIPENLKLILDFSNFYFSNTVIENYNNFLFCNFNENAFFDETCKINKVYYENSDIKKCNVKKDNFHDSILTSDNSLYRMIKLIESGGEDIMSYFRKYFRTFQKGSKLFEKVYINDLPKINYNSIHLDEINSLFVDFNILKTLSKEEASINPEFKHKILKLINQNINFSELIKVRREIEKRVIENETK